MRILHLSDLHIRRDDGPNADGVDPRASLRGMLAGCEQLDVDLVVVSGDVADDGTPEAYAVAREIVGAFAAAHGAAHVYCMGNHDRRSAFASTLGSGHLDAAGRDAGRLVDSAGDECAAVSDVAGARVVTLDSSVPGSGYGWIGEAQLDWLRSLLAVPAEVGTVLVVHHPPIAVDIPAQRSLMLQNPDALARVIAGTDVRLVLCGHFHLQLAGGLGGIPVVVTPGVLNRVDLTAADGTERAVRGASATVHELAQQGAPMSYLLHARDPGVGQTVYDLDADELAAVLAEQGFC